MKTQLEELNPWWYENYDFPKKIIERNFLNLVRNNLANNDVILFHGTIGLGKTFTLYSLINELLNDLSIEAKRIIFLDCKENIDINNILNIVENNSPKKTFLFLDNANEFKKFDKLLTKHKDLLKIIASSNKEDLNYNFTNKLHRIEITPLSFSEFLQNKKIPIPNTKVSFNNLKSINEIKELENNLKQFLIYGGYPQIILTEDNRQKELSLLNLTKTIFNKSTTGLEDTSRYLSLNVGKLLNLCDLAEFIGISRYKAEKNISSLEDYRFISFLPSYDTNIKKALNKSYKIFLHDTGFRNALINFFNSVEQRNDLDSLCQNFIALELCYFPENESMSFFRTTNQTEINFIIENNNSIIPIQVVTAKQQNNIPRIFKSFILQKEREMSKMLVITKDVLKKEYLNGIPIYFIPTHLISFWNGKA